MTGAPVSAPRFTLISATYDVARYLPDFIASIEAQTFDLSQVEVIMVDDGSTDDSAAVIRAWQQRRPGLVRLLEKPNGGQASARNLGLEHARGAWVSFPDPDDILEPDYLREVDDCLREHPEVDLIGTARILLDDATGERSDTHPLRRQFNTRRPVVALNETDTHFYGSAPCAFFERSRLEAYGLRFDAEIRPNFEDGFFCDAYLLEVPDPVVGFLKRARYVYRKRADATSTLQRSLGDPDRYTRVLERGYLGIFDLAQRRRGRLPGWLQAHIVYELSYFLSTQDRIAGFPGATGETATRFHALMREILRRIDPSIIREFRARNLKPVWRDILLHAYDESAWHQESVLVGAVDRRQRLVQLTYRFCGEPPAETVRIDGRLVEPTFAKIRSYVFHEAELMSERIVWVPASGAITVQLDGRSAELIFEEPRATRLSVGPREVTRHLERREQSAGAAAPGPDDASTPSSPTDRLAARLAAFGPLKKRFTNAWVLMDRVHDSGDSAEILFRYLRSKRRKINAWFVVEAGSPDYRRLRAEGYRRVVAHGSLLWKVLMLNCKHLISSHADLPIIDPPALRVFGPPRWRFTFLQHGVIKDDISAWLNPKPITVFCTSTPQERASISGDHTPYVFSDKEVVLTGLPRFDRLREIGGRFAPEQRDLVLVTPTWRHWLLPPLASGSQRRQVNDDFLASDFARLWTELLRSEELADLCRRHGLTLGFLPHPNLAAALPLLDLPDHVQALRYEDGDVQELFARAAVLVTDYSSIAFNAAYLDRPVVYFQFDAERVLDGGHVGRRGYFDYERDGFGPLTRTVAETVGAVTATVEAGRAPLPPYAERIAATFPLRDGKCCERTVQAIVESARPRGPR